MRETTPLTQQDTTVSLPDVSILVYRELVRELQATHRDEAARIGRGLEVLLGAEIRPTAELGRYLVQSCADSGIHYEATSWSCTCPDRQRHDDARCKHSWALELITAASAIAAYDRAQTRYVLTAKGERALAAPTPPAQAPITARGPLGALLRSMHAPTAV